MPKSTKLGYEVKTDWKGLDALWKRLQDLNQKEIEYGFVNEAVYPSDDPRGRGGQYVADIAWMNENGFTLPNGTYSPPRPFFTQSLAKAKWFVRQSAPAVFMNAFQGKQEKNMVAMGEWLVESVQETIGEQNFEPNAALTLEQKSPETRILHDTSFMFDNITAKIVNRDAYGQRKKEVDIK